MNWLTGFRGAACGSPKCVRRALHSASGVIRCFRTGTEDGAVEKIYRQLSSQKGSDGAIFW